MLKKYRWIGVVLGLLLFSVSTQAILIFSALSSPSFSVEEGYSDGDEAWATAQAQQAINQRLAWTPELTVKPGSDGKSKVRVELYGTYGKPMRTAEIRVRAFQIARGNRIVEFSLIHVENNFYQMEIALEPAGLWEFELEITNGEERFVHTTRRTLGGTQK